MERVDLTIIGGGPVGLFGAFYAGMRGMSVRIIDSLSELGGQLVALYPEKAVFDMPGFPSVSAKDLANGLIQQGTQFSPEIELDVVATGLTDRGDSYDILGSNGATYPTKTVMISAGAGAFSPTKLGVDNEELFVGKGISYGVKSKAEFEGKKVLVIGGGDSAFDWAVNLHPIAKKVVIVHRRDEFRAHEETVKEASDKGIEFMLWKVVNEIRGADRLSAVCLLDSKTKENEWVDCDAVIVNIGFKSSLGPLKEWGLEIEKNQIVVDNLYQTNLPRVFAVGDVCTYPGKLKLIATGVGEAATAVCVAKTMVDPSAKLFPGHSSDMNQFVGTPS